MAEALVAHQLAPDRIVDVEVGIKRQVRALGGAPEVDLVADAFLRFLDEGKILESQIAGLQIGFARAGLGRDQFAVGLVHHDLVDIGQLTALLVDPVIEGIAPRRKAGGGRPGDVDPGLQARQIRIVELVHVVLAVMQSRPIALTFRLGRLVQRRLVAEVGVEFLEIDAGTVNEQGRGAGQARDEKRIGRIPGIAHRYLVDDLELGRLAVDDHHPRRARGRQVLVVGDVLPPVAEVFRRKGTAVRPLVAAAQGEGKDATVVDLETFQDIGLQGEIRTIADQTGVAPNNHVADVLGPADQGSDVAAVFADGRLAAKFHDGRFGRQALRHGRPFSGLYLLLEIGCFHGRHRTGGHCQRQGSSGDGCGEAGAADPVWRTERNHDISSLALSSSTAARTKCPSPISIKCGLRSPVVV